MSSVLYVDANFIIACKEHDLPTVPLRKQVNGVTLLSQVASEYPEVTQVHGKNAWEGSALHRLDNATGGLVVFARNQKFYDYLQSVQDSGLFLKTYIAYCDEHKKIEDSVISSYFRAFGPGRKQVKAEQNVKKADSDRLYSTKVIRLDTGIYECTIRRGFRHQIRVHLSSNGCPIKGDNLYNDSFKDGEHLQLDCIKVEFPLPDGKNFTYSFR